MQLIDIIHRQSAPKPWAEGEKIPWNDPEFSRRMLREHLSQAHDAASRRSGIIAEQVHWIHQEVLKGKPGRVLDLGCGPGLYTQRLTMLGHACTGIDFSPASIAHAREQAGQAGLTCQYIEQDIRTADYGEGYDLAMLIFGEFNVFRSQDAKSILAKAQRALAPGGFLLLEPHTYEKIVETGMEPRSWYSTEKGLFSDAPHLMLHENQWDAEARVAIQRYYVIEAGTGAVTVHSSSMQAYSNEEYRALLAECGFSDVTFFPALGRGEGSSEYGLFAILARKAAA